MHAQVISLLDQMVPFVVLLLAAFAIRSLSSVIDEASVAKNGSTSVSCGTGNPIDDCWSCDPNWDKNRMKLAECAVGFGKDAMGGKNGKIYVVTNSAQDDPVNPRPGTLRHAVIQVEPLWIIFSGDMNIYLKQELTVNSQKTIDGRGANVHIGGGACITIHYVTNVIIHGVNVHDCKRTGKAMVRTSPTHVERKQMSDGDGISVVGSRNIWVDHCSLSRCTDGLIDVTHGSSAVTVSNNYFSNHDKVMLFGASDSDTRDRNMQVTVAYNRFGEGLTQRMPRCRHGYFHIVNNDYTNWKMYAIGGSANPTINSQGNRFLASNDKNDKEVTKREDAAEKVWRSWNWRSAGDMMLNGAFFTASGTVSPAAYAKASSVSAKSSSLVGTMTMNAGALRCQKGYRC